MLKERRVYAERSKIDAVRYFIECEKNVGAVAKRIGLRPSTLSRWVKQYRDNLPEEEEEVRRLKLELRSRRVEQQKLTGKYQWPFPCPIFMTIPRGQHL